MNGDSENNGIRRGKSFLEGSSIEKKSLVGVGDLNGRSDLSDGGLSCGGLSVENPPSQRGVLKLEDRPGAMKNVQKPLPRKRFSERTLTEGRAPYTTKRVNVLRYRSRKAWARKRISLRGKVKGDWGGLVNNFGKNRPTGENTFARKEPE